ncbi:uncharacterized protein LOC127243515 isoform X2 [Andrographis paniculata]|uniref:uncharacterized protein LOC127243515 isoform X2 n=1 Tax=Andrographis paniculata TaxID=175694 RepID=UPI0021E990AC|nr:uncharacterized protein LOC127243515 isoform X2 [Andrographis paniculata]
MHFEFIIRMNSYKSQEYCSNDEFDYQAEFNQFLEEARKNTGKGTSNTRQVEKDQFNGKQKKSKSWRCLLFTWLKLDTKIKSREQKMDCTSMAKPRRKNVSGPVQGSSCSIACGIALRAVSGPLTCILSSTRGADEYEVPYTSLEQINNTRKQIHPYGPIYSVT